MASERLAVAWVYAVDAAGTRHTRHQQRQVVLLRVASLASRPRNPLRRVNTCAHPSSGRRSRSRSYCIATPRTRRRLPHELRQSRWVRDRESCAQPRGRRTQHDAPAMTRDDRRLPPARDAQHLNQHLETRRPRALVAVSRRDRWRQVIDASKTRRASPNCSMRPLANVTSPPWSGCASRRLSRYRRCTSRFVGRTVPAGKPSMSSAHARGSTTPAIVAPELPTRYERNVESMGPRQRIALRRAGATA